MHLCVDPGSWARVGHGAAQPHGRDLVRVCVGVFGLWIWKGVCGVGGCVWGLVGLLGWVGVHV